MELIDTAFGPVPLWGDYRSGRSLVLAIRGAFANEDHLNDLAPPDADLALLHLPGFNSPGFGAPSIQAFSQAFDEVVASTFPEREITVVGVSAGSLVALNMQAPQVRRVLAVEPFFSTAKLWPLIQLLRVKLMVVEPDVARWIWEIFGVTSDTVEDRDYNFVLARKDRPAFILAGNVPFMPPRTIVGMPSLTDDDDRRRLPHAVVEGGHILPASIISEALRVLAA